MTHVFGGAVAGFWLVRATGVVAAAAATALVAGCGSASGGRYTGPAVGAEASTAAVASSAAAASPVPGKDCPSGKPLPAGQGESRDYVDLVRFKGRVYYAPPSTPADGAVDASKLGPVVGTVLCSKAQHDSSRRGEPEWTDPGSTLVPDGGSIYAVAGVAVDCQVAARSNDGRLHVYTAQEPDRPANCPP